MTLPVRAVRIVMRQRLAARSIRICGTEADSSFFLSNSRIWRSSVNSLPNSFLPAYHLERQSRFTAIRRPIGFVFCPIRLGMAKWINGLLKNRREMPTGKSALQVFHLSIQCYSSDKTILTWQLRFRIGPAEPRAFGVKRRIIDAVCAIAS